MTSRSVNVLDAKPLQLVLELSLKLLAIITSDKFTATISTEPAIVKGFSHSYSLLRINHIKLSSLSEVIYHEYYVGFHWLLNLSNLAMHRDDWGLKGASKVNMYVPKRTSMHSRLLKWR